MKVKVGVIQDSPVFFDKQKTFEKLDHLVSGSASQGCELLVFPETFIPGYPRGFDFGTRVGNRTAEGKKLYAKYHSESVDLSGKDGAFLEQLSKKYGVYLVIGITEKVQHNGSLYCSMVYISPEAGILGVHRKVKPTGSERIFWAESDGSSLVSFDTRAGRLGGLICWENYMPLARMAMYTKGVQIYIAPTADSRDDWITTMKHIALEGRCFVLGCNQYFRKDLYPDEYLKYAEDSPNEFCEGGSVIVSPFGKVIAGPLYGKAGILTAELDLEEITQSKLDFDPVGHYNRPDIFRFEVMGQPETKQE